MLPCLVEFRSHPRRALQFRHSDEIRIAANPFQFWVSPARALGSLFSLFASRAFHNSFSFIDFRTLSKNSRVWPRNWVPFLNFYLNESAVTYPLSFHVLAHSFAPANNSTPLFPNNCALFAKNHPGWGYPQLSPRLERNALIANLDSSFGLPFRFLPQDTHPGSRVTPLPVAAFPAECYDLVFHDPC
jgi:hypothetical protein